MALPAWTIVKVPFPYTDRPVLQRRPALVVGAPATIGADLMWVLMITSATHQGWPGDIALGPAPQTGLTLPSIVRTAKIACIDSAHAEPMGNITDPATRWAVMQQLATIFTGDYIQVSCARQDAG